MLILEDVVKEQGSTLFPVLDFNLIANYLFAIEVAFFESAKLTHEKYHF